MRDAGGVLGGMSLERAEPFWTHMSAYKLQSLEMGNLGNGSAGKGGPSIPFLAHFAPSRDMPPSTPPATLLV